MSSKEEEILTAYRQIEESSENRLEEESLGIKLYNKLAWGIKDEVYINAVLNMIPDDFNGRLLDIPVGTGKLTYEKYKCLNKAHITAVDDKEERLKEAKRLFVENGLINVMCIKARASYLPFEDETFDLVLTMNGFQVFPYKNQTFNEFYRVLKKGGLLCGCFYVQGERELTDLVVNRFHVPGGWFMPPFYTKEEINKWFKAYYSEIEIENEKSILYFKCRKLFE